jgi:hypothetical protein
MKKSTIAIFLIAIGLVCNQLYRKSHLHGPINSKNATNSADHSIKDAEGNDQFKCDGRKYCSEMTSCEEAKFFLENCPGVAMDGDNDGIPCEKQWCK